MYMVVSRDGKYTCGHKHKTRSAALACMLRMRRKAEKMARFEMCRVWDEDKGRYIRARRTEAMA